MLLDNFTRFGRVRFLSGGAVTGFGTAGLMLRGLLYENARFAGQKVSIPQGYTQTARAWVPALSALSYKVAARLGGDSSLAAAVVGKGVIGATLSGNSTITANPYLGLIGFATLQGNSTLTPVIVGRGKISARIDAGAQPSAFDIAQEVLGSVVEAGVDLRQVLRLLTAVAVGKTDIDTSGADPVVSFRDLADTKDRVTATMLGSERATVVLDAT